MIGSKLFSRVGFSVTLSLPVLVAESKQTKSKAGSPNLSRKLKPSHLPLYEDTEDIFSLEYYGKEPGKFEENISLVRKEVVSAYKATGDAREAVQTFFETGRAHSLVAAQYVWDEQNVSAKVGAITLGGLLGFLISGRKGGFLKKTLFTCVGATGMTAMVYPKDTARLALQAIDNAEDYSLIAYNFIAGVKPQSDLKSSSTSESLNKDGKVVSSPVPPPEVSIVAESNNARFKSLLRQSSDVMQWGFRLLDQEDVTRYEDSPEMDQSVFQSKGVVAFPHVQPRELVCSTDNKKSLERKVGVDDCLKDGHVTSISSGFQTQSVKLFNPEDPPESLFINGKLSHIDPQWVSASFGGDEDQKEASRMTAETQVASRAGNEAHAVLKVEEKNMETITTDFSSLGNAFGTVGKGKKFHGEADVVRDSLEHHLLVRDRKEKEAIEQNSPGNDDPSSPSRTSNSQVSKDSEPINDFNLLLLEPKSRGESTKNIAISPHVIDTIEGVADKVINSMLDLKFVAVKDPDLEEEMEGTNQQSIVENCSTAAVRSSSNRGDLENDPILGETISAEPSPPTNTVNDFADALIDSMLNIRFNPAEEGEQVPIQPDADSDLSYSLPTFEPDGSLISRPVKSSNNCVDPAESSLSRERVVLEEYQQDKKNECEQEKDIGQMDALVTPNINLSDCAKDIEE